MAAGDLLLDAKTAGRLFLAPDGSTIRSSLVREQQEAPAGFEVFSNNIFVREDQQNGVIAYRDARGDSLWLDALYIHSLMLDESAPERMGTVAFGLMAVTAAKLGFHRIGLFAAGHGPIDRDDPEAIYGYAVWPKFGFDAPVHPAELNGQTSRHLAHCTSVQEIMAIDPIWWEEHGTGREMDFHLDLESSSWTILLNYVYNAMLEDE